MKLAHALLVAALAGGCYAETQTSTTMWAAPQRFGRVESVQESVITTEGQPVVGAAAGALLGGLLFGGRHASLPGAVLGAGVGAAASSGSSTKREYHVVVAFDGGDRRMFVFHDVSPFLPGDEVVMLDHGLARR